jgi:hypothetical protein
MGRKHVARRGWRFWDTSAVGVEFHRNMSRVPPNRPSPRDGVVVAVLSDRQRIGPPGAMEDREFDPADVVARRGNQIVQVKPVGCVIIRVRRGCGAHCSSFWVTEMLGDHPQTSTPAPSFNTRPRCRGALRRRLEIEPLFHGLAQCPSPSIRCGSRSNPIEEGHESLRNV